MAPMAVTRYLAESDQQLLDVDLTRMLIFGAVMLVATVVVVIWALIVPEKPPRLEGDPTGEIVRREQERAAAVTAEMQEEAGRTDPAVRRR